MYHILLWIDLYIAISIGITIVSIFIVLEFVGGFPLPG